jgi:hypothetical protein
MIIDQVFPNIPEWIVNLETVIYTVSGTILSLKFFVTNKISLLNTDLIIHIKEEKAYKSELIKEVRENSNQIKAISIAYNKYSENDLFFKRILQKGEYCIEDMRKYNRELFGDVMTKAEELELSIMNKKANTYVEFVIEEITSFSRDVITIGIEEVSRAFLVNRISLAVQRATRLFCDIWGQEHSTEYIRKGSKERLTYIDNIVELSQDVANNLLDRFRTRTIDYTNVTLATFRRYYYLNHLSTYKGEKDEMDYFFNSNTTQEEGSRPNC